MTALTPDKDAAMTQEKLTDEELAELESYIETIKPPDFVAFNAPRLIAELRRHRAAAEPKEDMLDKASTWLAAYHTYTTGNRQYAIESLAMEFESISTESTRKERERAAGWHDEQAEHFDSLEQEERLLLKEDCGRNPRMLLDYNQAAVFHRTSAAAIRTPEEEK